MVARSSHSVVATDAPKAPAVMRMKFSMPDADAVRSTGIPDKARLNSGMKKKPMAAPWIRVGSRMVAKSASVLNSERIHSTNANTEKPSVAKARGSTRLMFLPTHGVTTNANRPTGAIAKPARVGV